MTTHKFLTAVGSFAVAVAVTGVVVAVDFDFNPLLTLPIVRGRKWIKKALCLSRRRVSRLSHFLTRTIGKPKASGSVVAFFGLPFLAKQKR